MSAISRFPIKNLLSQLNKREQKDDQGGDHSDDHSPAVIVGLVIAGLTLLLAIMSYRHSRFGRSQAASSLLPSHFINSRNSLHQVPRALLPNLPTTTPPAGFTGPTQVFVYNNYSGARFAGPQSTFLYRNNTVSSEDMRAT
ncbi:hypothetical protein B9Z19DRAFT_1135809 [Tuber borchii]|uniref:Uncharacterized protein n=1 Tax=Tuber borchii TaxID=42251 RepID=A0A2T6ZC85_TUBBO|nr:hypothetical protein B9Z19DRAFT_1135809 [Tuber borchii]